MVGLPCARAEILSVSLHLSTGTRRDGTRVVVLDFGDAGFDLRSSSGISIAADTGG